MIKYYLITAEKEPSSINIQTSLQRFLSVADYEELQKQLYQKIQEKDYSHIGFYQPGGFCRRAAFQY